MPPWMLHRSFEILSHALITHFTINYHVGGLTKETMIPQSNIQYSKIFVTQAFSMPCWFQHNMLAKWITFTRDLLHFNTKLLDSFHHQHHHAALIGIQHNKWSNIFRCHFKLWLENIFNPFNHCPLIHPCIFLAIILTAVN